MKPCSPPSTHQHRFDHLLGIALLLTTCLGVGAVEAVLPQPQSVEIHPDGAVFQHRIDLPAGTHRLEIPDHGNIHVSGAHSWAIAESSVNLPAPELPAAVAALQAPRDALLAAVQAHRAAQERNAAAAELARLALMAAPVSGDVDSWSAHLDRLQRAEAALGAQWQQLQVQLRDLLEATVAAAESLATAGAPPAVDDPGAAVRVLLDLPRELDLLNSRHRLGPQGLAVNWANRHPPALRQLRHLVVSCPAPSTIGVARTVDGTLSWRPVHRLLLTADATLLRREATISGARDLPAGTTVFLLEQPLTGGLDAPQLPQRALRLHAAPVAERRHVVRSTLVLAWADPGDARPGTARLALGPWTTSDQPDPRRVVLPALDGDRIQIARDQWVVLPPQEAIARRLVVLTTAHDLPRGRLEVEREGRPLGSLTLPGIAAGGGFALMLERDERIFVSDHRQWPADPQRSSVRRREGSTTVINNLGTAALSVSVLLTRPVATHPLVSVLADESGTAGAVEEQAGLLRYDLRIPAGEKQTIEHGWILETTEQVQLEK